MERNSPTTPGKMSRIRGPPGLAAQMRAAYKTKQTFGRVQLNTIEHASPEPAIRAAKGFPAKGERVYGWNPWHSKLTKNSEMPIAG